MWFVLTLIAFAVLSWVGYTWMKILFTKYEHTLESFTVLASLFMAANYLGLRLTYAILPALSLWPRLLLMLLTGFLMFTGFSCVAVNLWCAFLTRDFDDKIAQLEEEKEDLQRQLEMLRWRHITQGLPLDYQQDKVSPQENSEVEIENLQRLVDSWQEAGGAARVRSIKVAEWKSLAGAWGDDRLRAEIGLLNKLIEEEKDESKRDQMKAKLAVFRIELLSRESSRKPKAESQVQAEGKTHRESGPELLRRRLQDIHAEIQLLEAQKRDFLRGKVRLGWRVRP